MATRRIKRKSQRRMQTKKCSSSKTKKAYIRKLTAFINKVRHNSGFIHKKSGSVNKSTAIALKQLKHI